MAIETPHKHVGFNIQFDALIQRGTIHINPADWSELRANTFKTASEFSGSIEDASNDTQISATQVGPISGPESGSGPLIPVHELEDNVKLPPAQDDLRPNAISPMLADAQSDHAGDRVSTPAMQPYPVGDVPAVPTSVDGVITEDVHESFDPEAHKSLAAPDLGTTPDDLDGMPEHPATEPAPHVESQEEKDKAEWLQKEQEAKEEHHEG